MKIGSILLGLGLALGVAGTAMAAGNVHSAKSVDFSFEGPFGKFDRAQLQRGFQVYNEVCSACHAMQYLAYRNLAEEQGPAFSEEEVKAIAAQKTVIDKEPNADGEYVERPARPSDQFVSPFPNKEAAIAANGAYPTDLSLITKARAGYHGTFKQLLEGIGGPEYVYSVLTGYEEEPAAEHGHTSCSDIGKSYNPFFVNGPCITMGAPLSDDAVEYTDGTPATVDQMARDVSAFLAWTAEPKMMARKEMGFRVMGFLIILAGLLYFAKRKVWSDVAH